MSFGLFLLPNGLPLFRDFSPSVFILFGAGPLDDAVVDDDTVVDDDPKKNKKKITKFFFGTCA